MRSSTCWPLYKSMLGNQFDGIVMLSHILCYSPIINEFRDTGDILMLSYFDLVPSSIASALPAEINFL